MTTAVYQVPDMLTIYVVCETYAGIVLMTVNQHESQRPQSRLISTTLNYALACETASRIAAERALPFKNYAAV